MMVWTKDDDVARDVRTIVRFAERLNMVSFGVILP